MFTQAQEVIDFIEKEEIAYIDVRFCDLPGVQQHFTIPASELQASVLKDGLMFDGSSVRGFTQIHESDMKLIPDITSAFVDPFRANKTLVIIFSIVDPFTDEPFSRDPRQVAAKAEAYLRSTGIADTCYIGAEAEFFVFNDVRYQVSPQSTFYALDSDEAYWNTGRAGIWDIKSHLRAVISLSPPVMTSPIFAMRCLTSSPRSDSNLSVHTTRLAQAASRRSTTALIP